jgi:hypothetical protein
VALEFFYLFLLDHDLLIFIRAAPAEAPFCSGAGDGLAPGLRQEDEE